MTAEERAKALCDRLSLYADADEIAAAIRAAENEALERAAAYYDERRDACRMSGWPGEAQIASGVAETIRQFKSSSSPNGGGR